MRLFALVSLGLVCVLMASGCGLLEDPASVDPSVIDPLPSGLEAINAGTFPCRGSGDIGWEYTYVVVLGDDGERGGRLHAHLESLGFALAPSDRGDWSVSEGRKDDILLRVGPVSHWRALGSTTEGPIQSDVEEAVEGWDGPAALIGLEPTDQTCEV